MALSAIALCSRALLKLGARPIAGFDEGTAESEQVTYEHDHLPKLESAGYIEWNRLTGQIARGPQFREIVPLLELLEEHADELPTDWP